MFKVRVIPCLDVKDGRVVKGVRFVDLRDAGDPVEAVVAFDAVAAIAGRSPYDRLIGPAAGGRSGTK